MTVHWEEVRDHVRQTFQVAIDEPARLGLVWRFANAEGPQRQYLVPAMAFGIPHVVITANVTTPHVMTAYDALLYNHQLAIGALCIDEGVFVLRVVLPLVGVDMSVIDRSLELLAHEAARLRTKATPKPALAPYYE